MNKETAAFGKQKEDMEVAGSLTPELSGGKHTRPHPFRYAGQDPEGAPPRGQEPTHE